MELLEIDAFLPAFAKLEILFIVILEFPHLDDRSSVELSLRKYLIG
jgi:hypothetical protein